MNKEKSPQGTSGHVWLAESLLIIVLVVLTIFMLKGVDDIQGTARVVNYAGIVRGGTQRLVKLELMGQQDDELIAYLNEILDGLENGCEIHKLVKLDSVEYQEKLDAVILYWKDLQEEILRVRQDKEEQETLLEMSETYFYLANDLVGSAENFSQKNATVIRHLEFAVICDIVLIFFLLIRQTFKSLKLSRKNGELSKTAYIDVHTGLPNKSKCEIVLLETKNITAPTACMMFDLNDLKKVNDTLGHVTGDILIQNFATILRWVIPEKYFLGRYGGDEFVAVLVGAGREEIELLVRDIQSEIARFNQRSEQVPISYACGYALSDDYEKCTIQKLLEVADSNMYQNKREIKAKIKN